MPKYFIQLAFIAVVQLWPLALCSFDYDHRPKFHFLPESNWMNDPNGPFLDSNTGYYHLMYQYLWPRTWGHAISCNLVDWQIVDMALNYSDAWYTEVPGATPGVYSGSATQLPSISQSSSGIAQSVPWLSVSVPTNDMFLLASPFNLSDPLLSNWTWDSANPIIYSADSAAATDPEYDASNDPSASASNAAPGRDPGEMYQCGTQPDGMDLSQQRLCMGYATQLSEGCPCSNVSGVMIYSTVYNVSAATLSDTSGISDVPLYSKEFAAWEVEGYLLNDTSGAVMWECPDLYNLFASSNSAGNSDSNPSDLWILKFSIGPGPSYEKPWGTVGPRDYYVTGSYSPLTDPLGFDVNDILWDSAMARNSDVSLDVGAFYASKTFFVGNASALNPPAGAALCNADSNSSGSTQQYALLSSAALSSSGRVLWGWLAEERNTSGSGAPYGWAGVQSLPREIIPYQRASQPGSWYVRTPVLESVLQQLRNFSGSNATDYSMVDIVPSSDESTDPITGIAAVDLSDTRGAQLEVEALVSVGEMEAGDRCGLRILASANGSEVEYTDISILFSSSNNSSNNAGGSYADSVVLEVNPSMSCADASSEVNRTISETAPLLLSDLPLVGGDVSGGSGDSGAIDLSLIVDQSVVETFLSGGRRANTRRVYPAFPATSVRVMAIAQCAPTHPDCACRFINVTSWSLRSANITTVTSTTSSGGGGSDGKHNSGNKEDDDDGSGPDSMPPWQVAVVTLTALLISGFVAALIGYVIYTMYWVPNHGESTGLIGADANTNASSTATAAGATNGGSGDVI